MAVEAHRRLRKRQQPFFHRRDRDAGRGVRVDHAVRVLARLVHRAVDDVAGGVHRVAGVAVVDDVARQVDLDQARGGHLLVQHAVGVDQDVVRGPRHAGRDVVVDEIGHPVARHQAVARREIDAQRPFVGADALANGSRRRLVHAAEPTPGIPQVSISGGGFLGMDR